MTLGYKYSAVLPNFYYSQCNIYFHLISTKFHIKQFQIIQCGSLHARSIFFEGGANLSDKVFTLKKNPNKPPSPKNPNPGEEDRGGSEKCDNNLHFPKNL